MITDNSRPQINLFNSFIPTVCGAPRWMPPKVLEPNLDSDIMNTTSDNSPFTKQSDIYSLGMTILEVLTVKIPYNHRRYDTAAIFDIIQGIRPPRPTVSYALWDLLNSCWQALSKNRPTAKEVKLGLDILESIEDSL